MILTRCLITACCCVDEAGQALIVLEDLCGILQTVSQQSRWACQAQHSELQI